MTLEQTSKKNRQKAIIQKAILGSLAIGGLLTITALAPNVLGALGVFGINRKKLYPSKLSDSLRRLLADDCVEFVKGNGVKRLQVTPKGRLRLATLDREGYFRKKPRRWDKKWRLVVFDIAEKNRHVREKVRRQLRTLGFLCLQQSVWIYPYDSEEIVTLIKLDKRLGRGLLYIIADQVEFDKPIREYFGLPT